MNAPATVAGTLGALLLAGCGALPGRPAPGVSPQAASEAEVRETYARNCAGCHGADGRLGPARPLADPLYLALVDDAALARIIGEGVPGSLHPAFARSAGGPLDERQIRALVGGMRAWWGSPETSVAEAPPWSLTEATRESGPGDPARGAEVFRARCAACHGPDGTGGARAGSVVDRDYLSLVTDQALRSAVLFGRPDLGMPSWRDAAGGALAPREVSDVVAWLVAHRAGSVATATATASKGERR
jgi:cytochrome c oxidase cbb3-type subunit 3